MVSFMGRAGASAGAAARALTGVVRGSQESRSNQRGERNKDYLSILTLRELHRQLVAALEDYNSSVAADTGDIILNGENDAESGADRRRDIRGGISGYIGGKGRVRVSTPAEIARKEVWLVEIIRGISELVALGEAREEPEYFEFFCERATMVLFVSALRLGTAVKIQVVQSVAILFQNLQSTIHIYMLLSQDHINRLIEPDASTGAASVLLPLHDEEFLANYVALLKAISVRLSPNTVQFFLNTTKGSFPLYSQSVPLIAHPDPLVRTSALSIVLHVFSVRDPGVSAFLALEGNHNEFFEQLARLLQDTYSQLLCRVWQNHEPPFSSSSEGMKAINESTGLFQDMLYYVQDVLEAADSWLSGKLAAHLHQAFFRPVVLEGLAEALDVCPHGDDEGDIEEEESEPGVVEKEREDRVAEAQVSLYAICQFYILVNNGALVDLVTSDLFGCGSSSKLSEALEDKGGMKGEDREAILRSEDVEGGKDTQQGTKLSQSSVGESPHAVGFRYRRALLACLSKKLGGGRGRKCLRLGACVSAGVSVLRCAANNPAAAGAVLRDRGVSNQGAWGTGPQGEENRKRLLSGSDSPVGVGSRVTRGGRVAEGTVLVGRYLDYDGNDNRGGIGDEASGACSGDRSGGVPEERAGNECFEQVVMHLLETIADDSKIDDSQPVLHNLLVKKNASAAIVELGVLDLSSGDESVRGGGGKRGGGIRIGPWRASKRLEHHRLGEALTRAYAQSSAVLLQATRQRSPPLALLTACKRAVELLGVGAVRVNGDVEVSTPLPPLVEMAASGLLLETSVVKTAEADEWDGGVALVKSALAFLILRHLHRWLVEGTWTPSSPAAASASIRVDSEFLALVGVDLAPHPATAISSANDENETSLTSSSLPMVGDRIRLSSRRCMACRLPYNWPASVVISPSVKERSSDASAEGVAHPTPDSLEIYVVLDDHNFLVASPDPDSPLDHGLLVCVTPLRNTVAKAHPANPQVLELRVSTQEAGQEGAGGPGLFLSTTNASPRNSAEAGSRWEGGVNFRGVGHRGLWHLVLSFQSNAACTLVAEHVTEQREAALATQTVGMVEMLRRSTAFLTASENSYPSHPSER